MPIRWKELLGNLTRGFTERADALGNGGRNDELQTMLSRDMTLAEAVHHHISTVWGLDEGYEIFSHEAGHVLLGLALNAPPHNTLSGHSYQGTYDAEIYNLEVEHILNSTVTGKQKTLHDNKPEFITGVLARYREFAVQENLMRTLGWLMERQSGRSYEDLRESVDYDDQAFQSMAEDMGITVRRSEDMQRWTVSAPGFEEDFFFHAPDENFLPGDLAGVDDFQRFERPHVREISDVYDRMMPAVHMLQQEVFTLDRSASRKSLSQDAGAAMGRLKIRDLYRAIVNRPTAPSPGSDPDSTPA